MSMKTTKVDGSVDAKNGLKYTVGDKSQGFLSRTIDKALGGMQESSEDAAQNNHPVTVPRRLRTTLTKTPRTLHPSGGPHGFRRQLLRRVERLTEKAVVEKAAEEEWLSRSLLLQMLQSRKSL